MRIVNLYVVNGQDVGTEKYAYKLRWLEAVHAWIAAELQAPSEAGRARRLQHRARTSATSTIPLVWNENHILTSTAERAALQRPAARSACTMPIRLHHAEAAGKFSWWDYRQAGFRRDLGLRIDLTLVSEALKAGAAAADIDREPRTWERPSDHAPAWVRLD